MLHKNRSGGKVMVNSDKHSILDDCNVKYWLDCVK